MMSKKGIIKKLIQRKKILGISFSISIFFIFIFSIFSSFIINELYFNNAPIGPEEYSRNIYLPEYYIDGKLKEKISKFRKTLKNKIDFKDKDFDEYKIPSVSTIELIISEAYDFDEQTSSIYAKGFINAKWDQNAISNFQDNRKNIALHEKSKIDLLSTFYLNFFDSENQIYKNVLLVNSSEENISKYEFSGRFRVDRDLRKFPFDQFVLEVKLISLLYGPDINLMPGIMDSFTDDKLRYESFRVLPQKCYTDEWWKENYANEQTYNYGCSYVAFQPKKTYSIINDYPIYTNEFNDNLNDLQTKPFILTKANFKRSYASSFFRYVLPLLVGITILFLTDFLPNKFSEFKLATPPTVLLTFIFMQNGYQAEIQQISYITFIDKLYYLSYFSAILQLSNTLLGINSRNRIIRKLRIQNNINLKFICRLIFLISTIIMPFILFLTS